MTRGVGGRLGSSDTADAKTFSTRSQRRDCNFGFVVPLPDSHLSTNSGMPQSNSEAETGRKLSKSRTHLLPVYFESWHLRSPINRMRCLASRLVDNRPPAQPDNPVLRGVCPHTLFNTTSRTTLILFPMH